jgi:hypothetical protein
VRLGTTLGPHRAHQKAVVEAKKEDLKPDAICVRLLAAYVAAKAPRPA